MSATQRQLEGMCTKSNEIPKNPDDNLAGLVDAVGLRGTGLTRKIDVDRGVSVPGTEKAVILSIAHEVSSHDVTPVVHADHFAGADGIGGRIKCGERAAVGGPNKPPDRAMADLKFSSDCTGRINCGARRITRIERVRQIEGSERAVTVYELMSDAGYDVDAHDASGVVDAEREGPCRTGKINAVVLSRVE